MGPCKHPREPRPDHPAQSMPCAWPQCPEGIIGPRMLLAVEKRRTLRIDFTDPDQRPGVFSFTTVEYEREHVVEDGIDVYSWWAVRPASTP